MGLRDADLSVLQAVGARLRVCGRRSQPIEGDDCRLGMIVIADVAHHESYIFTERSTATRQIGQVTSEPAHCSQHATWPHGTKTHSRFSDMQITHSVAASSAAV